MLGLNNFSVSGLPMVTIIGLMIAVSSAGQIVPTAERESSAIQFCTGPKFRVELEKMVSGSWQKVELRTLLRNLASQRRVAVLVDRRVDPTVQLPIDIVNRSLKSGFQDIARKVAAEISVPENVVFIGPRSATKRLRTLIELRSSELQSKTNPIREGRRTELTRRQTVSWDDLETPGNILRRIADQYQLAVRHPERVPHDLWGGCTLPGVTAAEALSVVLIQFDLTFAWEEGGQGIDLVPIPDQISLERRPRVKGRSAADAFKQVREHFPELDARLDGAELVVRGTLEEHEAVTALLNPSAPRKITVQGAAPLRQRTFADVKFERVPVRAIMKKLEESDVVFVYDAAALTAAGIDLDQTIDVQFGKATADEFFKAVFGPLKLSFEIDNVTVKLTPK